MPEIVINEADLRAMQRARQALLPGSLDNKRPMAWEQFGYPQTIQPEQLLSAYLRGGPGHGAIHHVLDKCWQEWPRVKLKASDEETPWETTLQQALEEVNAWPKLQDWDRRNMVGRYAGLILRVADDKPLREPVVKRAGMRLVDVVPVYEHQLKVTAWESDPASPNYGQPTMWQYRRRNVDGTDKQGQPDQWQDVHPDRILILAEGSVGNDFFDGVPLLQPGFNALIDLEKISGGAAESYLKNSARTITYKFDTGADPERLTKNPDGSDSGRTLAQALEDKTRSLNTSIDASVAIQGGEVGTLQTTMHDPEGAWMVAANTFAASVRIPFTLLFGQQTGRLASDEDKAADNARCKARQRNLLTPAVTAFVRRLQAFGVVESSDFEVEWKPLDAPGDKEKAELAAKLAAINKDMVASGRNAPFSENEVRKVLDYEEEDELDDMPTEGDPAAEGQPGAMPPGAA